MDGCWRVWSILLFSTIFHKIFCSEDEFRLLRDLRQNYDPVERPVKNHSEPVVVKLKILLQQIVDVDEKNQVLTVVLWFQTSWEDYKMKWNPNEYGGITTVRLPGNFLWKPDILLYNSADQNFDARFPVNFVVSYTGEVLHAPPAIVMCSCEIDITWFPFDEQLCVLKYGVWTYSKPYVDIVLDEEGLQTNQSMNTEYYIKNGEWDLLGTDYLKNNTGYANDNYPVHLIYLLIRRRTIYYGMNWIVPSILFYTSNVLGFTLPPECGEKITLRMFATKSTNSFRNYEPPFNHCIPWHGRRSHSSHFRNCSPAFFALSMITLGAEIIFTIVIINLHFRSAKTHKMGSWANALLLEWLPWMLLMNRPEHQFKKPYTRLISFDEDDKVISSSKCSPYLWRSDASATRMVRKQGVNSLIQGSRSDRLLFLDIRNGMQKNHESSSQESTDSFTLELRETLRELREFFRANKRKMMEDEEEEEARSDWHFAAMVLDRFCLYFFTIVCGVFIMIVFL